MDSAGIGLILGRYKMISMFGGTMDIINVHPSVKKVLEMAGITKIIPVVGGAEIGKNV
jgi:stage II sporulation protein AA (anti-sigma F factor antagonist)